MKANRASVQLNAKKVALLCQREVKKQETQAKTKGRDYVNKARKLTKEV